jgi:hypothetical protein
MVFCNNFGVTICHKSSLSGILKITINTMVFLGISYVEKGNLFSKNLARAESSRKMWRSS